MQPSLYKYWVVVVLKQGGKKQKTQYRYCAVLYCWTGYTSGRLDVLDLIYHSSKDDKEI